MANHVFVVNAFFIYYTHYKKRNSTNVGLLLSSGWVAKKSRVSEASKRTNSHFNGRRYAQPLISSNEDRMPSLYRAIWLSICLVVFSSCANPLNQATSNRYSEMCAEAKQEGRLDVAEQACYRALVNVYWGNLGKIQKSDKMYNLAQIKRHLGKFEEAEDLYKQSLMIEEKESQPSMEKIGRRLAELAILYGEQGRLEEGFGYVEKLYPLSDIYVDKEKRTVAGILYVYSTELEGKKPEAQLIKFRKKATEMGFDPKVLTK